MNPRKAIPFGLLLCCLLVVASCSAPPAAQPTQPPAQPTAAAAQPTAAAAQPTAAAAQPTAVPSPAPLKVGWICSSSVNDQGWCTAHDRGRQYVVSQLQNVSTQFIDEISDTGGADVERVVENLVSQGNKVIVGTSFGYSEALANVASRHPDVIFLNESQYVQGPNIQSHYLRFSDGFYLTGVLAGKMTKSNIIGMVATFPIPELLRRINGFALGVQSVNPKAVVKVVWTNSWYDPSKEKQGAESLIAVGADVIQHQATSPAVIQACESAGVYSIGYQNDQGQFGPKYCLTSMMIEWGGVYAASIKAIQDGTWKPGVKWFGLADGVVGTAPYGPAVTEDAKAAVEQARQGILSGKLQIFAGPIKDQAGTIRIPAGTVPTDDELLKTDYFVQGIDGTIPAQ